MLSDRVAQRIPEAARIGPQKLLWDPQANAISKMKFFVKGDGYGGPHKTEINGRVVRGIRSVEIKDGFDQFCTVTIEFGGVGVTMVSEPKDVG